MLSPESIASLDLLKLCPRTAGLQNASHKGPSAGSAAQGARTRGHCAEADRIRPPLGRLWWWCLNCRHFASFWDWTWRGIRRGVSLLELPASLYKYVEVSGLRHHAHASSRQLPITEHKHPMALAERAAPCRNYDTGKHTALQTAWNHPRLPACSGAPQRGLRHVAEPLEGQAGRGRQSCSAARC